MAADSPYPTLWASVRAPAEPDGSVGRLATAVAPDALVAAAREHRLTSRLHRQVGRQPLVPQETRQALKDGHDQQQVRHLLLSTDLATLAPVLDAVTPRWAVVKGPAAGQRYHPVPEVRESSDLDVLVDARHLGPVLESLAAAGATPVDRNWPLIAESLRGELTWALPHGTMLDLHWHLLCDRPVRDSFSWQMGPLLDRAADVEPLPGVPRLLDPTDALLHLCAHAALAGGHRLSWWLDIALAARQDLDADTLLRRARAAGLHLLTAVMLGRVDDALDLGLDPALTRALAGSSRWPAVVGAAERVRPPVESSGGPLSLRRVTTQTRAGTVASVGALTSSAVAGATALREPERAEANPLHLDVDDAAARERYLAGVAADEVLRAPAPDARTGPDYASLAARWVLGAAAHPGGAALTREAVRRLGLPRAARLADLGCGTGASTVLLARAGARVDAVDVDPGAVRLARARAATALVGDRVQVTCADLHHLPLPTGAYAAVLLECVASTLHDPRRVLERAAALLRPGGRLLLTDVTLDRDGLAARAPEVLAAVDGLTTGRSLAAWADLVAEAGLRVDVAEDRRPEAAALCRRLELRLPTKESRRLAGEATGAVRAGLLSYGLVLATRVD